MKISYKGFSSSWRKGEMSCRYRRAENGEREGVEHEAKREAVDPQNKRLMAGSGVGGCILENRPSLKLKYNPVGAKHPNFN